MIKCTRVAFGVENGNTVVTHGVQNYRASSHEEAATIAVGLSRRYGRLSPMPGPGLEDKDYTKIMRAVRNLENGRNGKPRYVYVGKCPEKGHYKMAEEDSRIVETANDIEGVRQLVVQKGVKIILNTGVDRNDQPISQEEFELLAS